MTVRQQFITDIVEYYIKNNKEEYKEFLKMMKWRRSQLSDKQLAQSKDKKSRVEMSMPAGLINFLDSAVDNPRFLNDGTGKEIRWFAKKYPQFQIPMEL